MFEHQPVALFAFAQRYLRLRRSLTSIPMPISTGCLHLDQACRNSNRMRRPSLVSISTSICAVPFGEHFDDTLAHDYLGASAGPKNRLPASWRFGIGIALTAMAGFRSSE